MKNYLDRTFCVAPMMGYTTPHARNLYRILSKKTFLFEYFPKKSSDLEFSDHVQTA